MREGETTSGGKGLALVGKERRADISKDHMCTPAEELEERA